MNRMQKFWNEHAEWSQATFGTDAVRGPLGALRHFGNGRNNDSQRLNRKNFWSSESSSGIPLQRGR